MKTFDIFRRDWQGRQTDYDHRFQFQCVDVILQGLFEMHGINGAYGNAIDFWKNPDPKLLKSLDLISTNHPIKGDIVVLRTYGRNDLEGDGHIGWSTGAVDAVNFELFEQNGYGGGDGLPYPDGRHRNEIGTRWVARTRIVGVLRPKAVIPYTKAGLSEKQVILNKSVNKYDLNQPTIADMAARPVYHANQGYRFAVNGLATHINGERYYMEDYNGSQGWNVKDVDDYIPPVTPYVPPAKPVEVKLAETYMLDWEVPTYPEAIDAQMHRSAYGVLKPRNGGYIVYKKNNNAYNLTEDNMKPGVWINTDDNVPPKVEIHVNAPAIPVKAPEPVFPAAADNIADILAAGDTNMATDWRKCTPVKIGANGEWLPVKYKSVNDIVVQIRSLDGKLPATLPLPAHHELNITSTFMYDGIKYARDDRLSAAHRFYALPFDMLRIVAPKPLQRRRMDSNGDGDVNISDFIDYGGKLFKNGITVVRTVAKTIQTEKAKRFIDGIKERVK